MLIASILNQASELQSVDVVLVEKASWGLRQRLRKQMNQLTGCFFDEVDDFIFVSVQQGQFSSNDDYFGSMRELRAKQILLGKYFLILFL